MLADVSSVCNRLPWRVCTDSASSALGLTIHPLSLFPQPRKEPSLAHSQVTAATQPTFPLRTSPHSQPAALGLSTILSFAPVSPCGRAHCPPLARKQRSFCITKYRITTHASQHETSQRPIEHPSSRKYINVPSAWIPHSSDQTSSNQFLLFSVLSCCGGHGWWENISPWRDIRRVRAVWPRTRSLSSMEFDKRRVLNMTPSTSSRDIK